MIVKGMHLFWQNVQECWIWKAKPNGKRGTWKKVSHQLNLHDVVMFRGWQMRKGNDSYFTFTGLSKEDAMKAYISKANALVEKYGI